MNLAHCPQRRTMKQVAYINIKTVKPMTNSGIFLKSKGRFKRMLEANSDAKHDNEFIRDAKNYKIQHVNRISDLTMGEPQRGRKVGATWTRIVENKP